MVYPIIFPLFIRFQPSKVMQDFFHPQYLLKFISDTAFRTIWSILACGQRLKCACPSFKLRCWPSGWSSCNSKSLPVMCACVASWVIIGRMEISYNHLISLISPRNRKTIWIYAESGFCFDRPHVWLHNVMLHAKNCNILGFRVAPQQRKCPADPWHYPYTLLVNRLILPLWWW